MTSILTTVLKVNQRESASVETSEQLSFVMQTVSRLVRESSNIEIATSSASSALKLKLRMKDSAKDPTCLYLENQAIKLAEGPDAINPQNCNLNASSSLTSGKVIADKLDFSKISNYPGHDVVSIDIQLIYNSQNPESQITRNLKSAIARVSAATFDSNLLPGSNNSYDIGFSGTNWRNANLSGDLLIAGNVGIGTTAPSAKLSISGGTGPALEIIRGADATNAIIPTIRLQHNTRRTYEQGVYYDGTFRIKDMDSGNYAMTIDSNQNVGIGTVSPGTSKLRVIGSPTAGDIDGMIKLTDDVTTTLGLSLRSHSANSVPYVYGNTVLAFGTNGTERVRIDSTGNVGIGTSTPAAKLTVVGGDNSFAWSGDHSISGYIRIGNMQICWGDGTATNPTQPYYVAYSAFSFPSGCTFNNVTYSLVASPTSVSGSGKAFAGPYSLSRSTTGATVYFHKISDPSQEDSTATGNMPFTWQAIGTWQ